MEISKNILVVEGDEEDFEALVRAIEARDWWVIGKSEDLVKGIRTVEVKRIGNEGTNSRVCTPNSY
jgi:hypothetical protein